MARDIGEASKSATADLHGIVGAWLKYHGYDGLCCPDHECGCGRDDLFPCECPNTYECVPAFCQEGLFFPAAPEGGEDDGE